MDKPLNVVLLLAGGHGFRMHTDRPKQFMEIAGEPVISYTLQAFQRHPEIDRIYVVCNPEWNEFVKTTARNGRISKLHTLFPGRRHQYRLPEKRYRRLACRTGGTEPCRPDPRGRASLGDGRNHQPQPEYFPHTRKCRHRRPQPRSLHGKPRRDFFGKVHPTRTAVSRTDPDNLQSGRPDRSVP